MSPANLVLNVNTPKYFVNESKRPADSVCATIHAKKPKFALGKSLRVSTQNSKSKITTSLNNVPESKNYGFKTGIRSSIIALKESRSSILSNPTKNINEAPVSSQNAKVTFNSEVQYLSNECNNSLNPVLDINSRPIYSKETQGKNMTSSLFSRIPDIPEMPKLNVKSTSQEVFSSKSFKDLDIAPQIISNVEKFGYTSMTKVQQQSIPHILAGKDALIKSQTGSGKTLSYALPIIHKLMTRIPKVDRSQGTYALIVVPTRELAIQTYQWMEKLCKTCVWVVPGYLIGGEKKKAEKSRIRKGINILVSTPGRLTDHINNTNCLSLLQVQYLVLDEADRMLEMGYEKSIKSIIYALNQQRQETNSFQTIMLSATLTSAVEKLAGISMNSPAVISLSNCDLSIPGNLSSESLVTPQNLSHFFMIVPPKLRLVTLAAFILEKCKLSSEKKMLIFMSTQDMVDYHTSLFSLKLSSFGQRKYSSLQKKVDKVLIRTQNRKSIENVEEHSDDESDEDNLTDKVIENNINFFKLHGNMSQPERTAVFKSFCDSKYGVLLSTDVASRGLDLPKLNWIVQYTPAGGASDYVHRVGRTARGNLKGSAVVFINPTESTYVTMLEKHGIKFSEMRMEKVLSSLISPSLYETEDPPTDMEGAATSLQLDIENLLIEDKEMYHMATRGFVSFIRSYAAIPREAREFFCFKLLHLGHFAKSFGLRDTPSVLGARGGRNKYSEFHNKKRSTENRKPLFVKRKAVSEFDSGFDGIVEEIGKKKAVKKVAKDKKRVPTFKTKISKGINTASYKSRVGKMVSKTVKPKLKNKT